jgi:hypothetical protein
MIDYALTSATRVKNRLGLSATDTTRDAVIDRMIASATAFIEHACGGRRFKKAVISNEVYDGSSDNSKRDEALILKNAPAIEGQSITLEYQTGDFSNPSWVAFTTSIDAVDYDAGIIYVKLPTGKRNVRVSYTAGYLIDFTDEYDTSAHTLPFDLTDLCERLVVKLFKRRDSEGRSQESFNNSSITWGDFLEAQDKEIVANYSRRQFV